MIRTLQSLKAQAAEVAVAPALDAPPPPAAAAGDGCAERGAGIEVGNPGSWLPTQAAMADHPMRQQRQHRVSFAEEVDEVPVLPGGHPASVTDGAMHGGETQAAEPSLQFQMPSGSGSARASGAFGSSLGLAYVPTQGASEAVSQLPGPQPPPQKQHSPLIMQQSAAALALQTQVASWGCWKSPGIGEREDKLAAVGQEDDDAAEEEEGIRGGDEGMEVGEDHAGGGQEAVRAIGEEIDAAASQEGDDEVHLAAEPDLTVGMDTTEEGDLQESAVEREADGMLGGDKPRDALQDQRSDENEGYSSQPLSAKQGQSLAGFQRDALGCLSNLQRLAAAAGGMPQPIHESEGYVQQGQPHASLALAGFSSSEPI